MKVIDLKNFEHLFKEAELKAGLNLCKKGAVVFKEKLDDNWYSYFITTTEEINISIKKKGDTIIDYKFDDFTDKKLAYLCAIIFYLEKDNLGIEIKESAEKKTIKPKKSTSKKNKEQNFKEFLYGIEYTTLLDFIEKECVNNTILKQLLLNKFLIRSEDKLYDFYCDDLKLIILKYKEYSKLSQKNIEDVYIKINTILNTVETENNPHNLFLVYLAFINIIQTFFGFKLSGKTIIIDDLYTKAIKFIENYFTNTLTNIELKALNDAVSGIIKSKELTFADDNFLILKKYILITNTAKDLVKLYNEFNKKRTYYNYHRLSNFEIIKYLAYLKYNELNKTEAEMPAYHQIEFYVAKAELLINKADLNAAVILIEKYYDELTTKNNQGQLPLNNYLYQLAELQNNKALKIKCLCDELIFGSNTEESIQKLNNELNTTEFETIIKTLIQKLQNTKIYENETKIVELLVYSKRINDLITFLKNNLVRFSIVNYIAKTANINTIEFIDAYIFQLLSYMQKQSVPEYQVNIFISAQKYIDTLPINTQTYLLEKILGGFNKQKQIYIFIKQMYPHLN